VSTITVVEGDITAQEVDVIVNAANAKLLHGGGVAAAISLAGGPIVDEESRAWVVGNGPVGPGRAAVTSAGDMPASDVVHVVGPVYQPGADNEEALRLAVNAALDTAQHLGASTVALPAISAGIYGYPTDEATAVITDAVVRWLDANPGVLTEVRLVAFGAETAEGFRRALEEVSA
jgi:O-acetyl-ADP-ribose deacetylase (regulator of RNase III)